MDRWANGGLPGTLGVTSIRVRRGLPTSDGAVSTHPNRLEVGIFSLDSYLKSNESLKGPIVLAVSGVRGPC